MTVLEMRAEIHRAIDNAPEILLPQILKQINDIQNPNPSKKDLMEFVDKVFKEDEGLLRRLAQ